MNMQSTTTTHIVFDKNKHHSCAL